MTPPYLTGPCGSSKIIPATFGSSTEQNQRKTNPFLSVAALSRLCAVRFPATVSGDASPVSEPFSTTEVKIRQFSGGLFGNDLPDCSLSNFYNFLTVGGADLLDQTGFKQFAAVGDGT